REDIAFGSMTSNSTEPALIGAVAGASLNKVTGPVAGNIGVYVLDVFNRETGAFYTEDEAKVRQSQVTNYQINNLSSIFVKEADVVDNRARFF
ncbi:MAG: peptidylprolyl isomerase, partial [Bacteroidales bacterium]|nr:peptidylprolyl isomerase [Bacteroidales bacterium]